ncbi:MAG: hypothetical protein ABEI97_00180 [Candidatus Nanohaloarchaea archaeon]
MTVKWHPAAVQEFLALDDEAQEQVNHHIEKLPENGLSWEKVERVKREHMGLDAFRLKIDPDDAPATNHRVLFDVDNSTFFIAKIGVRPGFYHPDNLGEAEKRL